MILTKELIEGSLYPSEDLAKRFFLCTLCSSCALKCPSEIPVHEHVLSIRRLLSSRGLLLRDLKLMVENAMKLGNPRGLNPAIRFTWLKDKDLLDRRAPILLWIGCTIAYRLQHLAECLVNVFKAIKIDFMLTSRELCCGSPLFLAGLEEEARESASKVQDLVTDLEVKTVVVHCPSCFRMFREIYPDLGVKLRAKIVHTSQFLLEALGERSLGYKLDYTVTYHDPCELGKHMSVYECCCGGGGDIWALDPDVAIEAGRERAKELARKARTIATSCPVCYMVLRYATLRRILM